jgi:hypothetical protein
VPRPSVEVALIKRREGAFLFHGLELQRATIIPEGKSRQSELERGSFLMNGIIYFEERPVST